MGMGVENEEDGGVWLRMWVDGGGAGVRGVGVVVGLWAGVDLGCNWVGMGWDPGRPVQRRRPQGRTLWDLTAYTSHSAYRQGDRGGQVTRPSAPHPLGSTHAEETSAHPRATAPQPDHCKR